MFLFKIMLLCYRQVNLRMPTLNFVDNPTRRLSCSLLKLAHCSGKRSLILETMQREYLLLGSSLKV
jgi:hypothetical protein